MRKDRSRPSTTPVQQSQVWLRVVPDPLESSVIACPRWKPSTHHSPSIAKLRSATFTFSINATISRNTAYRSCLIVPLSSQTSSEPFPKGSSPRRKQSRRRLHSPRQFSPELPEAVCEFHTRRPPPRPISPTATRLPGRVLTQNSLQAVCFGGFLLSFSSRLPLAA